MRQLTVPTDAAARMIAVLGEPGRDWLHGVADRVETLLVEWALTLDGPPFPGAYASLVLPVSGADGALLVLKLAPNAEWIVSESRALAHWRGRGSVRLERVDLGRGALLCERAVPGQSLLHASEVDEDASTDIVADVLTELAGVPLSSDLDLPSLESWTERLREHSQSPAPRLSRAAARAAAMASELHATTTRPIVLHGDLHPGNVLRATRQSWLAIDPKGLVGPAPADAAAYLRNPRRWLLDQPDPARIILHRMDRLAERLGQDVREIAGWAYVLAVLSAAWAVEDNETSSVIDRALRSADLFEDAARARR